MSQDFYKNKRAMQNVKKKQIQKQQEKICLIASCWLVVGEENKKNTAMNYKNIQNTKSEGEYGWQSAKKTKRTVQ